MNTVLTSLYIENFKAFKKINQKLSPNVTLVIGGRRTGKTSFIEALEILHRYARESTLLGSIYRHWWGLSNLAYDRNKPFSIGVTVEFNGETGFYRLIVDHRENKWSEEYIINNTSAIVTDGIIKFTKIQHQMLEELPSSITSKPSPLDALNREEIVTSIKPWSNLAEYARTSIYYWGSLESAIKNASDILARTLSYRVTQRRTNKISVRGRKYGALYDLIYSVASLAIVANYILNHSVFVKWIDFRLTTTPVKDVFGYLRYDVSNLYGFIKRLLSRGNKLSYTQKMLELYCGKGSNIETNELPNKTIYLRVVCGGKTITPPNMPLGLVKAIALGVALDTRSKLIIIDDFDEYLDMDLATRFIEIASKTGGQVVLTTRRAAYSSVLPRENIVFLESLY